MTEQSISLERLEETINVFGSFDENIRIIEGEMEVSVVSRDSMLKVSGENAENVMYAVKAIEALMSLSSRGGHQRAERALYHPAGPQRQREPDQPAGGGRAVRHRQGAAHQGQDPGTEEVCGGHQEERGHPGHRPRRHRQDLSGGGGGGGRLPGQGGQPHHPHPPRSGGG